MNSDILLYLIFIIPVVIAGIQKEKLNQKKTFIIWILISFLLIIIGILIEDNSNNELRSLSYFGSQMLFFFLILHKITRNIYFKIFKREPELGKYPKHKIDYIYTLIMTIGVAILPFLADQYIFKKF